MFHLFKHSKGKLKGKYDFAFVVRGKFIFGSNQGYERKRGCYSAFTAIVKEIGFGLPKHDVLYFQDDNIKLCYYIQVGDKVPTLRANQKLRKPYKP